MNGLDSQRFKEVSCVEAGFTLVEMLVVISILFILTAIAFLNFTDVSDSFKEQNTREQLDYDIRRARREALYEGVRVVMEFDNDGGGYSFGFDYEPFNSPASYDQVSFSRNLDSDMTITADQANIVFDSRGRITDVLENLITINFIINHRGTPKYTGILYPSGAMEFEAEEGA